jgi:hypothetical protein
MRGHPRKLESHDVPPFWSFYQIDFPKMTKKLTTGQWCESGEPAPGHLVKVRCCAKVGGFGTINPRMMEV